MLTRAALAICLTVVVATANAQVNVQELADRWVAAYNVHDRDALAGLYSADARLMVHGSPTVEGRESIEEFWAADFQEGDPLTLLTVTNSVNGVDMMLVHGDYRVIDRQDGSLLGAGRFAHIWKIDGRDWYLDRDLWNQPWEPYDVTSMATDVQALANRWVEAYNNHDRPTLAALYEPEAALMMHGAPTIDGRREIGDFWAVDFAEGNPLTLLTVTHAVDGVDMVLVHGNYEVVSRDDGLVLGMGRFAHIWFQDDGGDWVLDRDMWIERFQPYDFD
jgi:ketosteroid isomerase-like protein